MDFRAGINQKHINETAPQRNTCEKTGKKKLLNRMGDGTRVIRMLQRILCWIVGCVYPLDVSKWPTEPGLPIPQTMEDLIKLVESVRGDDNLAHEVHKEVFRCLTDDETPTLC